MCIADNNTCSKHTHTHTHTYLHAHTYIHSHTHIHPYTRIHTRTRTHIHTRTHTHTHTAQEGYWGEGGREATGWGCRWSFEAQTRGHATEQQWGRRGRWLRWRWPGMACRCVHNAINLEWWLTRSTFQHLWVSLSLCLFVCQCVWINEGRHLYWNHLCYTVKPFSGYYKQVGTLTFLPLKAYIRGSVYFFGHPFFRH